MLSSKKPLLALGLAVLLLSALGAAAWFLYQKIAEASAVIAEAEAKIELLEQKGREFSAAESGLKDYEEEIALLESAFLNESKFVDLLKLLEGLSKKANVSFSAKSAKIPLKEGEEAVLSFELLGNFSSTANFMALLDKTLYAGLAESVSIAPKVEPDKKQTGLLITTINYIIFNFDL